MELYKWRDNVAREKDESIAYVLPNHMLLMISEQLPKEMTGILACCDPVPQLVQSSLGIMHKIITFARELPLQVQ
jgi:exosome complex exonuclease RRP6